MLELKGKYNSAKVFTDVIGESAVAQIIELCCQPTRVANTDKRRYKRKERHSPRYEEE